MTTRAFRLAPDNPKEIDRQAETRRDAKKIITGEQE